MMSNERCKCPHHTVMIVLSLLAWVSGILFFWSSLGSKVFFGFDAGYWAWSTVILILLSKNSKWCKCCCGEKHCGTCPVQKTM